MQGKRAVIIIAVCLLALVVLSSETKDSHNKPGKRSGKLNKILKLMDEPTVDSKEYLKTGEKHGHVTEEWPVFSQDVQELHVSILGVARELTKEVSAELLSELKTEGPDFSSRWQRAYDKAKESIAAIKSGEVKEKLKEKVKDFESKLKLKPSGSQKADKEDGVGGKWKKVKSKLVEEFETVEKLVADELKALTAKIDKVFHRVHHHMAHKEHHPVLKCGSCGKQMTLKEFLLHYPDIVIDEEEWWTDVDVENFYLGWPEWANRYAVKCPQCEATNWVGPDFVSTEVEHKLEEALGEQPDEIME
jgi:uncharacterized protein YoxC